MCGIIGHTGSEETTARDIVHMLLRLEYRGYDSGGVAMLQDGQIDSVRVAGKLYLLRGRLSARTLPGRAGIGHTRWATHGAVTEANAHPHCGCAGSFAIAHNGIIENHDTLRRQLQERGHTFHSQTDSEVIVHLLEEAAARTPGATLAELLQSLRTTLVGEYAIVAIGRDFPDRVAGLRWRSPLVVGLREHGGIIASDLLAFHDRTRRVVFLADGEAVEISPDGVTVRALDGSPLADPEVVQVTEEPEAADRGHYPHFMLKEIHEQPQALRRTFESLCDGEQIRLPHLELDPAAIRQLRRVDLVACGTAWHAAQVAAMALEELAQLPARAVMASEYKYQHPVVGPETLVVAVSQSGETADTRDAAEMARAQGAPVIAITNTNQSQIHRLAHGAILTRAGPEIGVASTKCYTAQLLAGGLLALHLAQVRGLLERERMASLLQAARALPAHLELALGCEERAMELAHRVRHATSALYIGRRYNLPTALEGALKLKEISYIHAEGYGAGEMKHGPIALVAPEYPVVAVAISTSSVYEKLLSNIQEVRARRGPVIAVGTEGDIRLRAIVEEMLPVPAVPELWSPVVAVAPLQLLAYHTAVLRGCDVDQPRNLAKSVTVE